MIRKAVVPAAGLGTRLLPITKELPKEMLPIFTEKKQGEISLKPMLQLIFEQLHDLDFREFCLIVGRGKRAIEDHFTSDNNFIKYLESKNKKRLAHNLKEFYKKIDSSKIYFVNQPEPRGFGDAVLRAKSFTQNENFLVHAGDDLILSKNNDHIKRLIQTLNQKNADATLLVERVENPQRYGVITGRQIQPRLYRVKRIIEKPEKPPTNIATIATYTFNPKIHEAIEKTQPDKDNETQLTDAIQTLIDQGGRVYAIELKPNEKRLDIGTPESYREILKTPLKPPHPE